MNSSWDSISSPENKIFSGDLNFFFDLFLLHLRQNSIWFVFLRIYLFFLTCYGNFVKNPGQTRAFQQDFEKKILRKTVMKPMILTDFNKVLWNLSSFDIRASFLAWFHHFTVSRKDGKINQLEGKTEVFFLWF